MKRSKRSLHHAKHGAARLTEHDRHMIAQLVDAGWDYSRVAARYGLNSSETVLAVLDGRM